MNERVIINKRGRVWEIPEGMEGIPIEKAWPREYIPEHLKGALIYEINGEQIIAVQDFVKEDIADE